MTNIAKQLHTSMNPCHRLIAISALALAVAAPAINTYAQGIPLAGQPGLQELEALAAQKASNANSPMVVAASAKGPAAVADEHAVVEQLARLNVTNMQILAQLEVMTAQKASNTK